MKPDKVILDDLTPDDVRARARAEIKDLYRNQPQDPARKRKAAARARNKTARQSRKKNR